MVSAKLAVGRVGLQSAADLCPIQRPDEYADRRFLRRNVGRRRIFVRAAQDQQGPRFRCVAPTPPLDGFACDLFVRDHAGRCVNNALQRVACAGRLFAAVRELTEHFLSTEGLLALEPLLDSSNTTIKRASPLCWTHAVRNWKPAGRNYPIGPHIRCPMPDSWPVSETVPSRRSDLMTWRVVVPPGTGFANMPINGTDRLPRQFRGRRSIDEPSIAWRRSGN